MRATVAVSLAIALAACASNEPDRVEFDRSAGYLVVQVCGDGFVRADERRLPLDALVLELRQRTREMTDDEIARFVVHLDLAADVRDPDRAQREFNRMIDQLHIMGVRQVEHL